MCSMVIVLNNTILYPCKLIRPSVVELKLYHHTHKKVILRGMELLTSLIVVIISQCICTSNNHAVHLKLTYISVVSPKCWKVTQKCKQKKWSYPH